MGEPRPANSTLDGLIERIRSLDQAHGTWRMSAGEVRELLGLGREEFYRRIYAAQSSGHPLVGLSAATDSFSQANIWEFVAVVELFGGEDTERRLQEAGVFFTHPEQLEIMRVFIATSSEAVRSHTVDLEVFSAMLRVFGRFDRACGCYLDEHFALDPLADRAAEQYCGSRRFGIPELARRNATGLLRYFFQKHVLEPRDLFATVGDALFEQAVREGYARRPRADRPRGAAGDAPGLEPSPLQRARRILELEGRPLSLPVLKSQYKRLIKAYHPDLNPAGLRRCQEINAAYSVMLSAL